jgi:acetyl-CoA carboxylase biotin carboxyl carrier protein
MTPQEMKQLADLLQHVPGMKAIELEDVQGLAQLLRDSPEIGSIEVKGLFGTKVVITRTGNGVPSVVAAPAGYAPPAAHPGPAASAPEGETRESARPASTLKEIKSPMVGTFYKSPEPGAEAYVKNGTRVTPGQTVCIIEAMKIMNEIEAEIAGVVREILVDDAQPVEFGQVLFRVDPNG